MRDGAFGDAWAVSDRVLAARDPATRDDPAEPYHCRWVWDGGPFDGRRVLVRCYHGLGDTLQFCRFLPALRRRAVHVTLEAQAELLPLLHQVQGVDRLVPFRPDAPSPPEDRDVEIMELPHALRTQPDGAPYLAVTPLPRPAPGILVGLCWQAGGWDPGRSLPLSMLAPLVDTGVRLVRLQRGAAEPGLLDPLAGSMDVLATARLIAALDLVVTVDTMVAHLAGALGVPTWLLLQAEADWRWMAGRVDSPWYGSMRLYRQVRQGCWAEPVMRLRDDLVTFAGNQGALGRL